MRRLTLAAGFILAVVGSAAPGAPPAQVSTERMSEFTRTLASDAFEGRSMGTAANCYHQTCDSWSPGWDLRGAAQEVELFYAIGARLANSRDWPRWNASSEFRKVRDQSEEVRSGTARRGGERG